MAEINDFGWVFIYVCAFGISDFFVKKFIKNPSILLLYYLLIGLIGIFLLFINIKLNYDFYND